MPRLYGHRPPRRNPDLAVEFETAGPVPAGEIRPVATRAATTPRAARRHGAGHSHPA
jgi:hypothetical protein